MHKIGLSDFQRMLEDPGVPADTVLRYAIVEPGAAPFDFTLRPDPASVDIPPHEAFRDLLTAKAGARERRRRQTRFVTQRMQASNRPVLLVEGDSWVHFPFLIQDVAAQLSDRFLVDTVATAGDSATNMVFGKARAGFQTYLDRLRADGPSVQALVFSGAATELFGVDPMTRKPALDDLLLPAQPGMFLPEDYIDRDRLSDRIGGLHKAYQTLIAEVRNVPLGRILPIILHGYDYPYPHPWGADDPRQPVYTASNAWMGAVMDAKGIHDLHLRRGILIAIIDRLYTMLNSLAGDPGMSGVWVVDCRGAVPTLDGWADEMHPTSDGFGPVADRFARVLDTAISRAGGGV